MEHIIYRVLIKNHHSNQHELDSSGNNDNTTISRPRSELSLVSLNPESLVQFKCDQPYCSLFN
ncbi:hypothetical protein [Ehrlichia minasensis]|uniref:hypothetical protein n=1 Tax=Ehrlichia minasensis TaxID=1242993 RepID=UPI00101FEF57|nr:hypothetical protein [Ehrlichia minasensis]